MTRFQSLAPIRPAKIMVGVICTPPSPSRMMPPETVFATSVLRNAPTRFRTAAIATATRGFSAPVAMGVAIAFAVSWKPLVKSKNSARAMTRTTMRVSSTTGSLERMSQSSILTACIRRARTGVRRMTVG